MGNLCQGVSHIHNGDCFRHCLILDYLHAVNMTTGTGSIPLGNTGNFAFASSSMATLVFN